MRSPDTSALAPERLASVVYAEDTEMSPEDLEMEAMMQAALQRAEEAFSQDEQQMRSLARKASSGSISAPQSMAGSQYLSQALAAAVKDPPGAGDDDGDNYEDEEDNFEEDEEEDSPLQSKNSETSPVRAPAVRAQAPPAGSDDDESENMPGEELPSSARPAAPKAPAPEEVATVSNSEASTPRGSPGPPPAAAADEVSTVSDDNVGSDVESDGSDAQVAGGRGPEKPSADDSDDEYDHDFEDD
jgi:hypothetical protein